MRGHRGRGGIWDSIILKPGEGCALMNSATAFGNLVSQDRESRVRSSGSKSKSFNEVIGARGPVSVPIRLQKEIEVLKKRPREKTDSAEITTDGSYIRPLDQSPIARSANL